MKTCLECGKPFKPRNAIQKCCGGQREVGSCAYKRMVRGAKEAKGKERISVCTRCKKGFITTAPAKTICGNRNNKHSCLYKHLAEMRNASKNALKLKVELIKDFIPKVEKPVVEMTPRLQHKMLVLQHNKYRKR